VPATARVNELQLPLFQETLIIWGDKDRVFPVDLGHRLHRYKRAARTAVCILNYVFLLISLSMLVVAETTSRHLGERSRLEIVKDAGHALQLEGAEHVNKFIKSFLLDDDERRIGPGVAVARK
jgi:pimeloyl-ACP methyl ester carboxylesterase